MIKPNVLPLENVPNARDLGGYVGADGRKIKSHRLLRTGKLGKMTEKDKEFLLNYGLNIVIDLRSTPEIELLTDPKIPGVQHYDIAIHEAEKVGVPDETKEKLKKTYDKDQYAGFKVMLHQYRISVEKEHAQRAFHKVLEVLANNPDGATIFHCSEGKDRTGLTAVYLLYILGVDPYVIRNDYLYSNYMLDDYREFLDKKAQREGANDIVRANLRSLGSVKNEYLDTALLLIEKEFGGLDNYLHEYLKVDQALIERLRDLYLEPKKA